jgi:hypothetical protein
MQEQIGENKQTGHSDIQAILKELGLENVTEAEIIEVVPEAAGWADRPDRDVGH